MKKPKIAVVLAESDEATLNLIRATMDDPALLELCTPVIYDAQKQATAYSDLSEGKADAMVLTLADNAPKAEDTTEIIVAGKTSVLSLQAEPTAETIVLLRNILERDLDLRSPRIAIVQDTSVQNPDLANQVTDEQGINTYGPYTTDQILADDTLTHFDGIVAVGDKPAVERIVAALSPEAPVRCFAGGKHVVTAVCKPDKTGEDAEGLADISWLTNPFYTATDIIRNRAAYDEARQNPLPKLFHDKREERRKNEASQAAKAPAGGSVDAGNSSQKQTTDNKNTEKAL